MKINRSTPRRPSSYFGGVAEHLRRRGHDQALVEEAIAEAAQRLVAERPDLLKDPHAARLWLRGAAHYCVLELNRTRGKSVPTDPLAQGEDGPAYEFRSTDPDWNDAHGGDERPDEALERREESAARAAFCRRVRRVLEDEMTDAEWALVESDLEWLGDHQFSERRDRANPLTVNQRQTIRRARVRVFQILARHGIVSGKIDFEL